MSRWVERNVERIRSSLGDELAVSGPVEQGRPAPTDMKGPGARYADRAIEDNHAVSCLMSLANGDPIPQVLGCYLLICSQQQKDALSEPVESGNGHNNSAAECHFSVKPVSKAP